MHKVLLRKRGQRAAQRERANVRRHWRFVRDFEADGNSGPMRAGLSQRWKSAQTSFPIRRSLDVKSFSLILALFLSDSVVASDPEPSWGAGWSANVWNTYCELKRNYTIPFPADPERRGFLSGSMFNSAFVRFTTTTQTHGNVITEDQLDILRFDLYVYPEKEPVPGDHRILSANIGGFESEARIVSRAEIHVFSLEENESFLLLQRFRNNEVVDFQLRFADGHESEFKIYPSGDRNFHVLEGMFHTCVRLNRN